MSFSMPPPGKLAKAVYPDASAFRKLHCCSKSLRRGQANRGVYSGSAPPFDRKKGRHAPLPLQNLCIAGCPALRSCSTESTLLIVAVVRWIERRAIDEFVKRLLAAVRPSGK